MNQVVLYPDRGVELQRDGVRIDTGGIGKGYAVDLIAQLFKSNGIKAAFINFGQSSVIAIGSPPDAQVWTLLLQFPDHDPVGLVELRDQAFPASDSLGRWFEIAGQRYGHLIDPRSGKPVTERVQAVVLAPSGTEAEALSKVVILKGCSRDGVPGTMAQIQAVRIRAARRTSCNDGFPLLPLHAMGQ